MNYNSELEGNNAGLRQILAAVNNLPDKGDDVTAETIAAALGYVPAKEESVNKLSEQIADKVSKTGITLGLHSDGKYYIFVDGAPVGTGFELSSNSGDVFGYVDENNNIVLNGNLADGSYSIKYEVEDKDGNIVTIDIGDLVLDSNVYYSVTYNLTNCTSDNNVTQVIEGESYSANINANDGYELSAVTVTMGGSPVTVDGGAINIASVTGNVVITAVAEEKQAAEPVTENITVTKEMSIVIGTGADRAGTASCCATTFIDVSNLPKPCVISLKQTRWAALDASYSGYVRFYIADKSGTKLASDYTHASKMPSGVTMQCNNPDSHGYDDVTITVTSDNIGKLRFAGQYVYDGTGSASEPIATLTYTPK